MRMASPMGRNVDDIVRLLTVLARRDERDALGLPADGVRYHERLDLASQLINRLRYPGILIGAAAPYGNTLKIGPRFALPRKMRICSSPPATSSCAKSVRSDRRCHFYDGLHGEAVAVQPQRD